MRRIDFHELQGRIEQVLLRLGLPPGRAAVAARLTAETDRDGVRTHGIARLPRFAQGVREGLIVPAAVPERIGAFGSIERWTGHCGPGNVAASDMMRRATSIAAEHGLGCVALADTSHWMRGGTYGWQAAEQGFAALCWTNTLPNLPPWGATEPALGNNPLVIAIPRAAGPIVLDIAMSQFSYGTLASYRERGDTLPVPGGYDGHGNLTQDPAAIERSQRALPIGFWKGSGLSFVLDVLAAMLAGGRAAHQHSRDPVREVGQSQVFLAIAPDKLDTIAELDRVAQSVIDSVHAAKPVTPGQPARYPGQGTLRAREQNLRLGVPVDEAAWQAFLALESSR